ncbi:MAG: SDR family oxidoreductase [Desulfobacterales bacterium]|nr:SDR family oxidoreductase [Desulfobacterales bacterium]
MKKILIAGATGYLGKFVVRELNNRGFFIRALSRNPERLDDIREEIDEYHIGQITRPDTLEGICDGMDVVFSSIGITKQKDKLTFKDVDYQGNQNLLNEAKKAGVKKFIYVSLLNGPKLCHLDIVKAHEDFVKDLKSSGIDYAVIRPTGYFSDMEEFLSMARKGRVFLIGTGDNRVNPIHGVDLAVSCADAVDKSKHEINVGGPEVMTWKQIATLALETLNQPIKITRVPLWVMNFTQFAIRIFSPHKAGLLAFFITMSTQDMVGQTTGTHTLKAHFKKWECNYENN